MREKVEELLVVEPEWAHFFERCCEDGAARLEGQAWQFADELGEGSLVDVQDSLFDLAREFCPDSPAADDVVFDQWASEIIRKAVKWIEVQGHTASFDSCKEALNQALLDRGRAEFRKVAREWAATQVNQVAA